MVVFVSECASKAEGKKIVGLPSVGKAPVSKRYCFGKVLNQPRENRVFTGKGTAAGKYASIARRSWSNLLVESDFYLIDVCATGALLRNIEWSMSAIGVLCFLFAFSKEGLSPLQLEKQAGKSTAKLRFPGEISSERGTESGDMRTSAPRLAEEKSVYCG